MQGQRQKQRHRRRRSVIDFTSRWVHQGFNYPRGNSNARRQDMPSSSSSPPSSAGSTNPILAVSQTSSSSNIKTARRRWYLCICTGFVLSLAVNVMCTVFVIVRLRQAAAENVWNEQQSVFQHFTSEAESEFIKSIRGFTRNDWYTDNTPINGSQGKQTAVHSTLLEAPASDNDILRWKTDKKYLKHFFIAYNDRSGEFFVLKSGLYQLYSNIDFEADSVGYLEFSQTVIITGRDELSDRQTRKCPTHSFPCYTSFIFSTLHLGENDSIRVKAAPAKHVCSKETHTFFGIVRLG